MVKTKQKQKRSRRDGKITQNCPKQMLMTWITQWCGHPSRARHSELWSGPQKALLLIKLVEVEGIAAELFKILTDDAFKVLHSICHQIWKTQQWPQDWKRSVFISIPKNSAKRCSNYQTIVLILHASKVMLKILQARLYQQVNLELPESSQKRQRNQRSNCQILLEHRECKIINSLKTSTFASLTV